MGRHGDVQDFDRGIFEEKLVVVVGAGHTMALGDLRSPLRGSGGDGDRMEASFAIGDEVAFIDDEAAAEDANARIAPLGQVRMDMQIRHERVRAMTRANP